jgi:hypothetical protein
VRQPAHCKIFRLACMNSASLSSPCAWSWLSPCNSDATVLMVDDDWADVVTAPPPLSPPRSPPFVATRASSAETCLGCGCGCGCGCGWGWGWGRPSAGSGCGGTPCSSLTSAAASRGGGGLSQPGSRAGVASPDDDGVRDDGGSGRWPTMVPPARRSVWFSPFSSSTTVSMRGRWLGGCGVWHVRSKCRSVRAVPPIIIDRRSAAGGTCIHLWTAQPWRHVDGMQQQARVDATHGRWTDERRETTDARQPSTAS